MKPSSSAKVQLKRGAKSLMRSWTAPLASWDTLPSSMLTSRIIAPQTTSKSTALLPAVVVCATATLLCLHTQVFIDRREGMPVTNTSIPVRCLLCGLCWSRVLNNCGSGQTKLQLNTASRANAQQKRTTYTSGRLAASTGHCRACQVFSFHVVKLGLQIQLT